jgi:MFS family permease
MLSELFPTRVRYTGSSLTFNLAGIFGASLAPYIATWLAQNYGLQYVVFVRPKAEGPRPKGWARNKALGLAQPLGLGPFGLRPRVFYT